jgi:2-dehydro-3-deoxy-D-arabinonate dehydratase
LVVNARREILGYTAGDDVSSRDIEGENPLYLPQAKVFDGSCALGPAIVLCNETELRDLVVELRIFRDSTCVFEGQTSTARIKREMTELVGYLTRELEFPYGTFLMTGTGIVPPHDFSLRSGDEVLIRVGELELATPVEGGLP